LFKIPGYDIPHWAANALPQGIIRNLPEDDYHSAKGVVSKSHLDRMALCPAKYLHYLSQAADERTDAMIEGSAFHCIILEPDAFDGRYVELPDFGPMQSSTNRKLRDMWITGEARGRTVLKPGVVNKLLAMRDSVLRHGSARLLRGLETEVTALWVEPQSGLPCKARADGISLLDGVFVDLKKTATADPMAWLRSAAKFRYHVQDAFYSRAFGENGCEIKNFVFIVVEDEPPYVTTFVQLSDDDRMAGEVLYMRELAQIRKAWDEMYFPGYDNGRVMDLRLPAYAARDVINA